MTKPTTQMDPSAARTYVTDCLKEWAEEGDTAVEDILFRWEDMCYQEWELLKDMASRHPQIDVTDADELTHLVTWRFAVRAIGEEETWRLIEHHLPLSIRAEYEALIRSVGPGYHPDTPFDGYEPPIHQYSQSEWEGIHARALDCGIDLYEFGLPIIQEMLAAMVTTYPDGSRSDQVVMEEVQYEMDRYTSGLHLDEVMLEVLSWSQAAQAAFSDRLKSIVG